MALMKRNMSVILYKPQIPENAGFTARSMFAFGFDRLVLVKPEFSLHSNSPAYKTSSGARPILDDAQQCHSLQETIANAQEVIGFSRRKHDSPSQHLYLDDWIDQDKQFFYKQNIALLFGPESCGLPGEAISLCTKVVEIPLYHTKLSLNLSHAVAIVLYEVYTSLMDKNGLEGSVENPARISQSQIKLMLESILQSNQDKVETNSGKKKRHEDIILNFLQRSQITEDEFSVLMNYFKV